MDRATIVFNCLLVFVGLLQAAVLGFTAIVSNKAANAAKVSADAAKVSADAAKLSADAIPLMERPYIFIHGILVVSQVQQATRINYNISNNGKLVAVVDNVSIRCGMEQDGRFPTLITMVAHPVVPG